VAKRTDRASRVVAAAPARIYRALTDPEERVQWLPPKGMRARFDHFDLREGGGYRMTLTYPARDEGTRGKTTAESDVVDARFGKLVPDREIVEIVEFVSDDPAFAGPMTMTWTLTPVDGGTEVRIVAEDVPDGIRAADHAAGLRSSLDNLAEFADGGKIPIRHTSTRR
jgi:uncharacterized protein YndB with AHSA1/START domain